MTVKQKAAFFKGERVYVRNFGTGNTWMSREVTELSGPVSFVVKDGDRN